MDRKRLYISLTLGCIAGYVWLVVSVFQMNDGWTVCLFKRVTGLPCPACGSTRAMMELAGGNPAGSLAINPNGLVLSVLLVVLPLWLLRDCCTKDDSLYRFYNRAEQQLKRKWFFGLICLLVVLNWIWNIVKGL